MQIFFSGVGSADKRPPLGGGWHGVSRDWGRESVFFEMLTIIAAFLSLSQLR